MRNNKLWARLICGFLVLLLVLAPLFSLRGFAADTEGGDSENTEQVEDENKDDSPDDTIGEDPDNPPAKDDTKEDTEEAPEEDPDEEEEPSHVHYYDFEINSSGDKLKGTCEEDDCLAPKISVKLIADNKVYDGSAVNTKLEGKDEFVKETGAKIAVTVTREDGPAADMTGCGKYQAVAKVTIGEESYSLKSDFEITKRTVSISGITAKSKVYDGTTNVELDTAKATITGRAANDSLTVTVKPAVLPSADAGVYTIDLEDLKIAGSKADNYELDLEKSQKKCEFVEVTRRDISDAVITLGPTLFDNGKGQTQTVESVKLLDNGVELPLEVTYTVRGNSVKDEGFFTMTISGTGNFTGSADVDFVVLPAPEGITGNKIKYGLGSMAIEVQENTLGIQLVSGLETAVKQLDASRLVAVAEGENLVWTIIPQVVPMDSNMEMAMKTVAGDRVPLGNAITFVLYETVDGVTNSVDGTDFVPMVSLKAAEGTDRKDAGFLNMIRGSDGGSGQWQTVEQVEMTFNAKDVSFTFPAKMNMVYALWGKRPSQGISAITVIMIFVLVICAAGLGLAGYLLLKARRLDDADYEDSFDVFSYLKNMVGMRTKGEEPPVPTEKVKEPPMPKHTFQAPHYREAEPQPPVEEPTPDDFTTEFLEEEFSLEDILSEVKKYDEPEAPKPPKQTMQPIAINWDAQDPDLADLDRLLNEDPDEQDE